MDLRGSTEDLVAPQRLPYMAGLDGLRAIAVMAVVFYHADFLWARGGFLGVEVFFVISGYLITSLLLVEWLRTGTIGLKTFWVRRARRLLPAVILLLVVVSAASILVYEDTRERMFGDVVSSLGYVFNWFVIVKEISYFESFGRPPLLRHLWSLSVEEQFYVVWPVMFSFGMALFKAKTQRSTIRSFLGLTILGVLASTAMMAILYTPFEDPSRVYYGTDTRVSGILVGVALALVWIPWRLPNKVDARTKGVLNAVGVVAILGLVVILSRMDEFAPFLYRGGFLLTSLATALVIAMTVHPASFLNTFLERPILKWIGTRSYGIYLWHWPIFMVTRPGPDVAWNPYVTTVVRVVATVVAVEASYRFVEAPIRKKGFRAWVADMRRAVGIQSVRGGSAIAASVLVVVVFLVGGLSWGAFGGDEPIVVASQAGSEGVHEGIVGAVSAEPDTLDPGRTSSVDVDAFDAETPDADIPDESTPLEPEIDGETKNSDVAASDPGGGEVKVEEPAPVAPVPEEKVYPSVSLISDSVALGALGAVETELPNPLVIDGTVSRQFKHARNVVAEMRESGTLGDVVVIHLGTNGPFNSTTFDEAMESLEGVERVIVLTVKVPRRWEASANSVIAGGKERWPDIEILDWHAIASANPEWFIDDQVHLNLTGMAAYAALLNRTINGDTP